VRKRRRLDMALTAYLRPLILAGGFLFILAGISIMMTEQPEYTDILTGIYTLVLWTFYLYLVFVFINILITTLQALIKIRSSRS